MAGRLRRVPGEPHWTNVFLMETPASVLAGLAGVGAAVLAVVQADAGEPVAVVAGLWTLAILSALVAIQKLARALRADQGDQERANGLFGAVLVAHEALWALADHDRQESHLRVTLHLVRGEHLIQATPYAGYRGDGTRGAFRRVPRRAGVAGRALALANDDDPTEGAEAYREQYSDDPAQYHAALRGTGFEAREANSVTPGRLDCVAVAITGDGAPIAALYADSDLRDFFNDDQLDVLVASAQGVAQLLRTYYLDD